MGVVWGYFYLWSVIVIMFYFVELVLFWGRRVKVVFSIRFCRGL